MANELRDQELENDGIRNLLFLVPSFTPLSARWCANLLLSKSASGGKLVFVTATQSPDDRIKAWQSHVTTELPPRIGIVNLGGDSRTGAGDPTITVDRGGSEIRVETIQNPGNLTRIGISLTSLLTDWPPENDQVVICFDSLTSLLQYVEVRTLYQFLHVLTRQVNTLGGLAHYHLDPTAHDEQTVNQLMSLFDGIVEPDGSDDWRLRTR